MKDRIRNIPDMIVEKIRQWTQNSMKIDKHSTPSVPMGTNEALEMLIDVIILNKFVPKYLATGNNQYFIYLTGMDDHERMKWCFWGRCDNENVRRGIHFAVGAAREITREQITALIKSSHGLRRFERKDNDSDEA